MPIFQLLPGLKPDAFLSAFLLSFSHRVASRRGCFSTNKFSASVANWGSKTKSHGFASGASSIDTGPISAESALVGQRLDDKFPAHPQADGIDAVSAPR